MAQILKVGIKITGKTNAFPFPDLLKEIDEFFTSLASRYPSYFEPGVSPVKDIELVPDDEEKEDPEETISEELRGLIDLFAGKMVKITHTNKDIKDEIGVCKTVHAVPGEEGHYNLELINGSRYGFIPEIITAHSVEGDLLALTSGHRRKIEVI